MNDASAVRWTHRLTITLNILLVVWATALIGAALPPGHRYEGGWIFGLAWLPMIIFAMIQILSVSGLPQKLLTSIGTLVLPYLLIGTNVLFGNITSIQSFVIQSAMLQFTTSMTAFALQATVFPILSGNRKDVSDVLRTEALPQLFGASLGFILSYFAFAFLLSQQMITTSDLPLLFVGIGINGWQLGRSLYAARS